MVTVAWPDTWLGKQGARALVPALMQLPHMTTLNVGSALGTWWVTCEGVCEGDINVVCAW